MRGIVVLTEGRGSGQRSWPRLAFGVGLLGLLQACATRPTVSTLDLPLPDRGATHLEAHHFQTAENEDLVGQFGAIQLHDGDTLPDVARHFGLGFEEIASANPDIDPWIPATQQRVLLPLRFVLPQAPRQGVVINLAAMRLFRFSHAESGQEVVTYPVGIGKEGRSTPTGAVRIERKTERPIWYPTENIRREHARKGDPLPGAVSPGPDNPLGKYAIYLSRPRYLIHGTNKPYSIGVRASNGCIRLYPEDIERLFTAVGKKESVHIVNQPYLLGWSGRALYLQAYRPHEELNEKQLKKRLDAELKKLEKTMGLPMDWPKIERTVNEARGVPVPILAGSVSLEALARQATTVRHPGLFYGAPQVPPYDPEGWYVRAAETREAMTAARLSALLNHQGPPIPARPIAKGESYQVLAGPYDSSQAAKAAAKRLRVDLELEGKVLAPTTELATSSGQVPVP